MAGGEGESDDLDVLLTLPDELRGAFKDPLGPIHTDANQLHPDLGDPVITVGDVVTRHLTRAGVRPDLAIVDWVTERETLPESEKPDITGYGERIDVENPAAGLSASLLRALGSGIERGEKTVIVVDGEEDLATVPVLAVAPDGASVVYGQPGEGMVHVPVDDEARTRTRELLSKMDGDGERVRDALGIEAD
ncbi:GTP-dependent dephospho-CoA kinase family protein [Halococcus thailandensis]|uniref:GTP-dependent dephospho-CoA kinase n=1 Tax=Halococcus thailandensis JCM 13552 TaxID=1227457 RepID=M0N8L3_9EURY|nr:GTP-dependent dephospho-CoA kinase family protein [Halococcus thailandensis]EMA53913.1 hypothetical protein C451_08133 [Halococcus thailandensis JCM 13552]